MKAALHLLALWLGIVAFSQPAGADSLIAEFTGKGLRNTRPFTVTGPWRIEWQGKDVGERGATLRVEILDMRARRIRLVKASMPPGNPSGTFHVDQGGEFYLWVRLRRVRWRIRVIEER